MTAAVTLTCGLWDNAYCVSCGPSAPLTCEPVCDDVDVAAHDDARAQQRAAERGAVFAATAQACGPRAGGHAHGSPPVRHLPYTLSSLLLASLSFRLPHAQLLLSCLPFEALYFPMQSTIARAV